MRSAHIKNNEICKNTETGQLVQINYVNHLLHLVYFFDLNNMERSLDTRLNDTTYEFADKYTNNF